MAGKERGSWGTFTIKVKLQEDWRYSRGLVEQPTREEKHRQAPDEGAVLLLTLTSRKALEDFLLSPSFTGV